MSYFQVEHCNHPQHPGPDAAFSGSDKLSITRVQQEVQHRTEAIESVVPLSECGTVQSMLKAVIAGFIASPDTPGPCCTVPGELLL